MEKKREKRKRKKDREEYSLRRERAAERKTCGFRAKSPDRRFYGREFHESAIRPLAFVHLAV